jgi:5-methylcytosine-specific restriction endonuclease McrA
MKNIEERGHIFVEGTYQNRESPLIVWCPIHNNEHTTTFYNYNRSQTGCPCCGRDQVSEKLTGRQYSEETLQKMTVAAGRRPYRGGKPRRWREDNNYRNWRGAVFLAYNNECAVTGTKLQYVGDLVVHHLNCAKNHSHLAYVPENGIVLEKELHVYFHKTYGYGNNTVGQFKSFCF